MFAIRHNQDPDRFLRLRDLGGVMQLIHAEGVMRGGRYVWAQFFDPEPELVERYERMTTDKDVSWSELEPDFAT